MTEDLELITTEALLDEIMRRFEHGVFAGMNVTVDNQDGTGDNCAQYVWKGCSLTCAGLAAEVQSRILSDRYSREDDQ